MGVEEPESVGDLAGDAELPDVDDAGVDQGVPDGEVVGLGDELHEVVMLERDEVVAPPLVDPADDDPVQQVSGVVGQVAQLVGQVGLGVERVGDVQDDLPVELPRPLGRRDLRFLRP